MSSPCDVFISNAAYLAVDSASVMWGIVVRVEMPPAGSCHSVRLAPAGHLDDIPSAQPPQPTFTSNPSILYSILFNSLGCLLCCQTSVDHGNIPRRLKWPRSTVLGFEAPVVFCHHHEWPLRPGGRRCANRRALRARDTGDR